MVRPLEHSGDPSVTAPSAPTRTISVTDPAHGVAVAEIPVHTAAMASG
jgi:hypothetical protein